jgi:peptide/nickel transport system permease protein
MGPLSNANALFLKNENPYWDDLLKHPKYDDFWQSRAQAPHMKDVKPAVLWVGGWFDNVTSRLLDILFAFPGLIFAMLAVAIFGPGLVAPVIALSIAYLPYIARVLRSGALRERHLPYIDACYAEGLPTRTIAFRHLLPNIMPLVFVQATLSFGYALVDLAAISYLGLGVQPPTPEWGLMIANGQSSILSGHPQESLYAGLMIVLTVVAFNMLGDQLATYYSTDRR